MTFSADNTLTTETSDGTVAQGTYSITGLSLHRKYENKDIRTDFFVDDRYFVYHAFHKSDDSPGLVGKWFSSWSIYRQADDGKWVYVVIVLETYAFDDHGGFKYERIQNAAETSTLSNAGSYQQTTQSEYLLSNGDSIHLLDNGHVLATSNSIHVKQ